jgi:urea transporter
MNTVILKNKIVGRMGIAPVQNNAAGWFVRPALRLGALAAPFARAYASVLFCDSPWLGAWFAALTWFSMQTAVTGLLCLLSAAAWARLLGLSKPGQPHLVNSLLTGLVIGAMHSFDSQTIAWVALAALLVTLCSHWLTAMLWQTGKLPLLSLPFTLVTWALLLTQPHRATILADIANLANMQILMTPELDGFFRSLGWLFLIPDPLAGALLFAGLVVASRYLALLAVSGYLAGLAGFHLFSAADPHGNGFNFMLTAMALGGIFTVPSRAGFAFALAGSALAGWLAVTVNGLLYSFALPLLTAPFLLAVYLGIGALSTRSRWHVPYLNLDNPAAPELAYERARLAQARGVRADSLPLALPFFGEWRVSQGFDGAHTHRDAWRHALDFHITENQRSHSGDGSRLSDYYCYGAPVLAPAAGQIVRLRADLPDMPPGEVDLTNNWGNFLLLRMGNGLHVKLAHLQQGSVAVSLGEWVNPGQRVAACGSSGRSPEPHLHVHVQTTDALGSPTLPFHFSPLLVCGNHAGKSFRLCHKPEQKEIVSPAAVNEDLAAALKLPVGCRLAYRLQTPAQAAAKLSCLQVGLTLLGQFRLSGSYGASVAFEKNQAVIGFYDRQGQADPLLDIWLLALGLTPMSSAAESWRDRPAMRLLPLGWSRQLLAGLLRPLGTGCDSYYSRHWDDSAQVWRQRGEHSIRLAPGIAWQASTWAEIKPGTGVRYLRLDYLGNTWEAVLEHVGWVSDN